jgi:hypothetical protein
VSTSSYSTESDDTKTLMGSWSPPAGIWGMFPPNETPQPPAPSSDPAAPTFYGEWDHFYSGSDAYGNEGGVQASGMAGGTQVNGHVRGIFWQQAGSGDAKIRLCLDSLSEHFRSATGASLQYLPLEMGDPLTQGNHYGREWAIPFIRFSEPS